MVDLSCLKPYIFNMSKNDISITEVNVKRDGIDEVFDRLLLQMDCTLYEGTYRQAQTIDFHYTYEVTKALYIIEHFIEGEENQKLLDRHLANIEYEKIHPPKRLLSANSPFEKETKRKAPIKRRDSSEPKEKKITVAERKKLNKLNKFAAVPLKLKL